VVVEGLVDLEMVVEVVVHLDQEEVVVVHLDLGQAVVALALDWVVVEEVQLF
jgi:hypothetical protein